MDTANRRKSDLSALKYKKSPRLLVNELGVFYKVRGGKMNGPFATQNEAEKDLAIFKQIVAIEEALDNQEILY